MTPLLAAGGVVLASAPAWASDTCSLGGSCGPYSDSSIPMANGFNTYVAPQNVGANAGSTETVTATDPGSWSATANLTPYGYTGIQSFTSVQQLTNDWNGSGWGNCSTCTDTPLTSLSALKVTYAETSPTDSNSIYEYAPDVWDDNYTSDVMLWADTSPTRCTDNGLSSADIIGGAGTTATIDGQTWTPYLYGGTGGEVIFILDGTSNTDPVTSGTCARQSSGTLDILAAYQWLAAHGVIANDTGGVLTSKDTISQLNTGWEITSADNTTFSVSSYSITATVGSNTQQAPAVTTSAASGVTSSAATLNGSVNPEGASTTYQFDWGLTSGYGNVTTQESAGSGTAAVNESANLTGLSPNTTYHYRIEATNSGGTSNGADQTFTTNAAGQAAPAVTTNAATSVTSSGATLNGSVNPEGAATTYQFDYGTTTSYGSSVPSPAGSAGSGTTAVSESQTLTGLSPSTTYHYRIEATNSGGTTFGADQTFTTSATSSKLVGNSSIASVTDDNPAGTAQAYKFTAGASGTSQTISFYVDSSNTATAGVLGIYSNNAGNPGTLKGKVSFTPQAGWNTVTLSGVSITSGTVYWLAELGTSGTLAYRDETGSSGGSEISGSSSLTTLPATWPVGAVSSSNSASEYVSG